MRSRSLEQEPVVSSLSKVAMHGVLEGWKAIAAALGLDVQSSGVRKRLLGWEQEEGLPIRRLRGRVFATSLALDAWAGNPRVTVELSPARR